MRPAFFATSVPLPIAMPMSAALIAGASFTPSPVMATTSPFAFSVSARSTLCSGATRPTTPIASIRSMSLRLRERRELGSQDRLSGDPELFGDRRAGDHVVTRHHPHADVGCLRVGDRALRLVTRRVEHADEARHLELDDVGEQVAVGVEVGRVEVAVGRGHHPKALCPPSGSRAHRPAASASSSHGMLVAPDIAVAARSMTAGAAPLTWTRTTSRPSPSVARLNVAISL